MFRTKPGEERALIEDWINRPALRELVEAFGGTWPVGDLHDVVVGLVGFSEIWDYRAGRQSRLMFHERHDTPDAYAEITYQAAEQLGLIDPPPPSQSEYDYLLILGGLATGVEPRVKYTAELLRSGLQVSQEVIGLGSFRRLQSKELPISRAYAPDAQYEIDHLSKMIEIAFNLRGEWIAERPRDTAFDPPRSAETAHFRSSNSDAGGPQVSVCAALSSSPANRPANTADTYSLLLRDERLVPRSSILIVTSSIYVPYQHIDAVQAFSGNNHTVETVGSRIGAGGPTQSPSAYRQEVRSMVLSIGRTLQLPSRISDA